MRRRMSGLCLTALVIGGGHGSGIMVRSDLLLDSAKQAIDFTALMDSAAIPGMSAALISNGEIEWTRGFGIRGAADPRPVDGNTVFEAASLSKPVVAYTALKLVDAGLIDLDRPLIQYAEIPELTDVRGRRITARMVLSHSTGLQNERRDKEPLAFAFEPGEKFQYSGEGFLLLQRVLESVTGESLDLLTQRLVFEPLKMTRTSFTWRPEFADNAAVGHGDFKAVRKPTRPPTPRAPSSLQTTAYDYALFVRAMLHGEGLKKETFAEMIKTQVHVAKGIDWGLGWSIETTDSARAIWHWGDNSNSGFTAFVWINPETQRGILYFANSTTGLSIVGRVLASMGGTHAAPSFMNYETFDSPSRIVRYSVEAAIQAGGGSAGLRKYDELKKRYDSTAFPESLLNSLGYRFLSLNRSRDAVMLFQRNVEQYPQSSNAFDSLGDGLAAIGDKAGAIRSYMKSYALDPRNEHALQEANRLRASH